MFGKFKVYYNNDLEKEYDTIIEGIRYIDNEVEYEDKERDCYTIVDNDYHIVYNGADDSGEYEEEYQPLETLTCVGVGANEENDGLRVVLIGTSDNELGNYNITINVKNYSYAELYKLCNVISTKVKDLYYQNDGNVSQEDILNIVRNEVVK